MPWEIVKDHPDCGAGEVAVVKEGTGELEACHMDEEAAQKHMAALYANEEDGGQAQRAVPVDYARSWALDDIHILRTADGYSDGRTVEAYAAVFDTPTEIVDEHGHYREVIARTAFNRTLAHGIDRINVFYNHALFPADGKPASGPNSVPIGSPVDIRAETKGLRTITRYNRSDLADSLLEAIHNGDIKGYSFRGRIFQSNPSRIPRVRRGGQLPTVTRTELGLAEYGPTPRPAYTDARILAVRALQLLASTPGLAVPDPGALTATPDPGPGTEDPRSAHSARHQMLRFRRAVRDRGIS